MRSFTTRQTTRLFSLALLTLAFGLVQAQAKTDFSGQPPQEQMGGESEQLHTAGNTDGEMEEEA